MGSDVTISEGVYFSQPKKISIGNNVWIDRGAILIAGVVDVSNVKSGSNALQVTEGMITVGNNSHIGIRTVIQGHGGIHIGDNFTSSTDVKLYSLSNDVKNSQKGTNNRDKSDNYYIKSPIRIGDNVWLGLNTIVLGGTIGSDCFSHPNTVVKNDVPDNSIVRNGDETGYQKRFQ